MSTEEWRPLPGTWGYEVSDQGRVRSWRPCRGEPLPRMLKLVPHGRHRVLNIMVDGKPRLRLVHQLVLEAFVGPRPDETLAVRHLNDDGSDNRLINLAYGTTSENMADRVRNGIHHFSMRTHCKRNHEFTPENTAYNPSKGSARICRTCARIRNQASKRRARHLRAA